MCRITEHMKATLIYMLTLTDFLAPKMHHSLLNHLKWKAIL